MSEEAKGLTSSEAKERLKKFGPNVLPEKPPPSDLTIFLSQLKSPLVYVLLIAGMVTFALREVSDTTIIFFAVSLNTLLGFVQERKASRALHALKKLIHPTAYVIRDGKKTKVDVSGIVPGDVVVLAQGNKIPADGKIVYANRFSAEEAVLTGESIPVEKKEGDEVFMGTIVASGAANFEVVSTGKNTKVGEIALSIQESDEDTPLKKQLIVFSRQISIIVVALLVFVFGTGIISGKDMAEIFTTSVALAVSSIPEGLLVALTVVLAIGMRRILARKGLVRTLVSAETLGGVTTICADKTGTLTQGKLQVVEVVGDEEKIVEQIASTGEDPIMVTAMRWAEKSASKYLGKAPKNYDRIDFVPFSPQNRFYASLNKRGKSKNTIYVNGAPELILKWTDVGKKEEKELLEKIAGWTKEGKRAIGLARRIVSSKKTKISENDARKDLEWVGILIIYDPVRDGVADALAKARGAGIKLLVITGDYVQTAMSVMEKLNIGVLEENVVLGKDLEKLSVDEVALKLKEGVGKDGNVRLFARTRPMQKLKIVEALKKNGEIVAMMGDGVNDAPALKKADIGIVVGEATDVAKESADLVLLDSSFETIIAAIEEGRGIFDNLRKIILYLMSDAFEGIFAVTATIIFGLPLPVAAAQILWINLISDGFPHLALTVDPKRSGMMKNPPRDPSEQLVAGWMRLLILIVSVSGGIMAFALFTYYYKTTGDLMLSQSITFATLGVNSLIYVFSVRTLQQPFWKENPLDNKWLNIAVIAGFFFQIAPFVFAPLGSFLKVEKLNLTHWFFVFSASAVMFIIIEIMKVTFRHKLKEAGGQT